MESPTQCLTEVSFAPPKTPPFQPPETIRSLPSAQPSTLPHPHLALFGRTPKALSPSAPGSLTAKPGVAVPWLHRGPSKCAGLSWSAKCREMSQTGHLLGKLQYISICFDHKIDRLVPTPPKLLADVKSSKANLLTSRCFLLQH